MGFKNRSFSQPVYDEKKEEPSRVIVISCEGRNTEYEYFESIKSKLKGHISTLVKVDVIEKEDDKSEPKYVLINLEKRIDEKYDLDSEYDQFWLVCDREIRSDRKQALLDTFPECQEKGYFVALTNPLFEFWLLMHIADINAYDKHDLLANAKVNKNRRFLEKELSSLLPNGFNKKQGKFNQDIVSLENIERALAQEQQFANEPGKIVNNLGSNIGELVCSILGKQWPPV